jgi:hypothetical protein
LDTAARPNVTPDVENLSKKVPQCVALASHTHMSTKTATTYYIVDRLHARRAAHVPVDRIAATVTAWLAELGVTSPMAEDLARAARTGNWPTVHAISDCLSLDLTVAA